MPLSRPIYPHPPIEEALCEIRFVPGPEWNLTIPGRLHEQLKADYPGEPRQQRTAEIAVPDTGLGFEIKSTVGVVRLPTVDNTRFVSVGVDVLSVHTFPPYETWED
ncbi:MAG: TIGR04255 family protein, partial [Bacteroidota bacterium]